MIWFTHDELRFLFLELVRLAETSTAQESLERSVGHTDHANELRQRTSMLLKCHGKIERELILVKIRLGEKENPNVI